MMPSQHFLKNCRIGVWPKRYAVVKAKRIPDAFVAVFNDHDEITVVANENHIAEDWVIEAEEGWKILSFRTKLPFELTGFPATVTKALADENVSIFAMSSYSTDHLLVKELALTSVLRKLAALGCVIPTV